MNVSYPEGLEEVALTEVVRCSERILTAASMFQLGEAKDHTSSHHDVTGPPLQTFLFDRSKIPHVNRRGRQVDFFELYAAKTLEALEFIVNKFGGLPLHDRVAIIVPDDGDVAIAGTARARARSDVRRRSSAAHDAIDADEFSFRDGLQRALAPMLAKLPTGDAYELVDCVRASASLCASKRDDGKQWLVLDTMSQMDGHERLFVLCVGLDSPIPEAADASILSTRSRLCVPALTAPMHAKLPLSDSHCSAAGTVALRVRT